MACCRVVVFLLLVIFTAAGVCSIFFPFFKPSGDNATYPNSVYLWYEESVTSYTSAGMNGSQIIRYYNNDKTCESTRTLSTAAAALAVAGCGIAGLATLMASTYICAGFRPCLCVCITLFSLIACLCFAAVVAITAAFYTKTFCTGKAEVVIPLKDANYNIVEGFILACVAAGGCLIAFFFTALSCGCRQSSSDKRRDSDRHY